ncbi:ABC transporter ATP-binding protein [Phyllobacterium endophyticum]|uniref:ABC transporter ATP-binding protein n=1 Tax=Phyllobacterium endophyticum TaxID=1149773 RepID=UPI001FEDBBD6|nr:ABC transporter ATP-binding protein [Phyllobacterium endophyticum]
MKTDAKIVAEGVTKSFGGAVQALEPFDVTIREGEFICILGPSGCGKSTFLRIVAGLMKPTSGRVLLDNVPITEPGPERGLVFQEYALFPWLTVLRNVMYGPTVRGIGKKEAREIALDQLKRVGLQGFENHFPYQLSGGMKQRVGIARMWANNPDVLLMDEPFGALDSITRQILQKDLLNLWMEEQKTVLFVTHSVEEAIYLSDRVIVMSARPGRITDIVSVPDQRPRNLLSANFIDLRAKLTRMVEKQVLPSAHLSEGQQAYAD